MSEERLKEIKDNIDIGVRRTTAIDWYASERVDEELELYNEVVRLREIIDIATEYIKNNATSNYFDKEKNMFRREIDLLEILKQNNLQE